MRRVVVLAVMQCAALGALTAPVVVGLALMISRMTGEEAAPATLAAVGSAGSVAAMIANPLFGWCADRTGGRRWWLIGGALAGVAGSAALPLAQDPFTLGALWAFTQVAYNACFGAINGLVSIGLAPSERTRAAGLFAAASFIGTLPGIAVAALFPTSVVALSITIPAVTAVVVLVLAHRIDEPERTKRAEDSVQARWAGVRETMSRPFAAVMAIRFVISVEVTAGLLFALFLFTSRWGMAEDDAVRLVALSTLMGAIGVVLGSLALALTPAARMDARILLAGGLVLLAAAMVVRGLAATTTLFVVGTFVAGVAIGMATTATRSLAHGVLPPEDSGLGLGLLGFVNSFGTVVAPAIAGVLLVAGGGLGLIDAYGGMYVLLAVPVLALLLLVRPAGARVAHPEADPGAAPEAAASGTPGPRGGDPGGGL
ncbi:MFS transporter [Microbacterium album]|uniref:MFS transporter n=1 Tax=Microbacterium album TaxID=2053191 RepID=A0A917IEN9_9MICO|nr:MFS transporter [Microbacterium album]GGH40856.1 MFS transporter [Microbacterium album]